MFVGFINITHEIKVDDSMTALNKKEMLKSAYDVTFKNKKLPLKIGKFKVENVYVCLDNHGCNYKKLTTSGKSTKDKHVLIHDENGVISSKYIDDPKNYITMFINGKAYIDNVESNFSLRTSPSMKSTMKVGLTKHPLNPLAVKADLYLKEKVIPEMNNFINKIFNSNNYSTNTKTSMITAQGGNLFENMTDNRLPFKMKNFVDIMERIDDKVSSHDMKFEQTNKKQFGKISFKSDSDDLPTLTISNFGYIDIKGAKTCIQIQNVFRIFKTAIKANSIQRYIQYDENHPRVASKTKSNLFMKGCPKNNPEAIDGICPSGYLPRPNKNKKICCYKKKLSKTTAKEIVFSFKQSNMEIPKKLKEILKPFLNTTKISSMKLNEDSNDVVLKKGKIHYLNKVVNCNIASKSLLKTIASKLNSGYVMKGTKNELCKDILRLLKEKQA